MSRIMISTERLMNGHEDWRTYIAVEEVEAYCDLLDIVEARIDALPKRGGNEEVTLRNVEAVISSYALEIGMKSLWALDNPDGVVKELGHDLAKLYDGLKPDTRESMKGLGLSKEDLKEFPKPFETNRYSMEKDRKSFVYYETSFLRPVAQLLRDELKQSREALMTGARKSREP